MPHLTCRISKKILLFFISFSLFFSAVVTARAFTYQELKEKIDKKNEELREIQVQREKILADVDTLNQENRTIQQEIKKNDYQISQLGLSIKSSEINIEKLGLEIESVNYQIKNIDVESELKKETIGKLIRELYEKKDEGLLIILLRNQSLADSVDETQRLISLNSGLTSEIDNLRGLRQERSGKLKEISDKKNEQQLENYNLQNRKLITEEKKKENQNLLNLNKVQGKIYQQKIDELEKMQAEINTEIESIESELRKQIDPAALPVKRPGALANPTPFDLRKKLTQEYGATSFAQVTYKDKFHNGIDIGVPIGTPIFAAEAGRIIGAGNTNKYCPPVWYNKRKYGGSYGKYILVKHANNLSTLYAHLSQVVVKENEAVERGDLIGYSGDTGFSTGPHLHFTVYANIYGANNELLSPEIKMSLTCGLQPYGGTINPLDYLVY